MPFKPLGHANPSGDLIIGSEIHDHLRKKGHSIELISKVRCRWVYYKPYLLLQLLRERSRILTSSTGKKADIWLSYHSYYKAPDLLGPACSHSLAIPYVIFQGIYSTKRRKKLNTMPGFYLNKRSLLAADHIFTNKQRDLKNLNRIIPETKLSYVAPAIKPEEFQFQPEWRQSIRSALGCTDEVVILTAAMMRPGVKTSGISTVLDSFTTLLDRGHNIRLIIIGDGNTRQQLESKARNISLSRIDFLGRIPRPHLQRYYSAADIFCFPGIEESLGMVYLEAQSCRLPVVAYNDWGGGEAIRHQATGLTSPAARPEMLTTHLEELITRKEFRLQLGTSGGVHIRQHHDMDHNYQKLEETLLLLKQQKVTKR